MITKRQVEGAMHAIQAELQEGILKGDIPYQHVYTARVLKEDPDELLEWTNATIEYIERTRGDDATLHALHAGLQLGYRLGRAAADDERL